MYDIRRFDTNFMADAVTFLKKNKAGAQAGASPAVDNTKRSTQQR